MKKAIVSAAIALGLAASASADTLISTTYDPSASYTLSSFTSYTVTTTLDVDTLKSYLTDTSYVHWIISVGEASQRITGIVATCNGNSISGLYGSASTTTHASSSASAAASQRSSWNTAITQTVTSSYTQSYNSSALYSDATDTENPITGAALTLTSGGTSGGSYIILTLTYADNTSANYVSYSSGQFWSAFSGTTVGVNTDVVTSLTMTSGLTSIDDAVALNKAAIAAAVPEPATATLSLLALAGLAARRRRK